MPKFPLNSTLPCKLGRESSPRSCIALCYNMARYNLCHLLSMQTSSRKDIGPKGSHDPFFYDRGNSKIMSSIDFFTRESFPKVSIQAIHSASDLITAAQVVSVLFVTVVPLYNDHL